jgi:hypothetical protein
LKVEVITMSKQKYVIDLPDLATQTDKSRFQGFLQQFKQAGFWNVDDDTVILYHTIWQVYIIKDKPSKPVPAVVKEPPQEMQVAIPALKTPKITLGKK